MLGKRLTAGCAGSTTPAPHLDGPGAKREELAGQDDPDTLRSLNDWAALVADRERPVLRRSSSTRVRSRVARRVLGAEHLRT
jgi:hypothetical protein